MLDEPNVMEQSVTNTRSAIPGRVFDSTEQELAFLRKRVSDLENFIEDANISMHWVGADGTILWANQAEIEYMGYDPGEYIGRDIREFHADENTIKDILQRLARNEKLIAYPARLKTKNGEKDVEIYSSVRFVDGQFMHTRCFTYDVSERKKLFEALKLSERKYRELSGMLEKIIDDRTRLLEDAQAIAHVGSWEWNIENQVVYFSAEQARIYGLGIDRMEISYDEFMDLRHEKDKSRVREMLTNAVATLSDFQYESVIVRPDGQERVVFVQGRVIPGEQGAVKVLATAQDITERKEREKALYLKTEELARSNAELEQFAYVASHDLKEPLRMIASYSQLLISRVAEDPNTKEYNEFIQEGVHRLQAIINDLLQYSRVGQSDTNFSTIDLGSLVQEIETSLSPSIEETGAMITITTDLPEIYGIHSLLYRLFLNLVENAVKFRKQGEAPHIRISAEELPDNFFKLSVADNGIGISPEYHDKIFRLFQRLHSRQEYEGTGLGLAICRKIVEFHGGRIWVESTGLGGSSFNFTLKASN
jgi:PAS domain S-box-containing protein